MLVQTALDAERAPGALTIPAAAAALARAPRASLDALADALDTLLDPLAHPDWQTWQVAVHGRLVELTAADALCVYTPLAARGRGAWYAPHLSEAAFEAYATRAEEDASWDVIETAFQRFHATGRGSVAHETELVPRAALRDSAFFHDFLKPHRILDLTVAGASFGGATQARLHFSNRTARPSAAALERRALVGAVLPAFRSGLALWRQLGDRRTELGRMLDALADAVLLYDAAGTLLHANPAALRLLGAGADADRLRAEAQGVAWSVGAIARRGPLGPTVGPAAAAHATRELRLGTRTVTLRGALAPSWLLGRDPGVLVTLETATAAAPTDAELCARFGLTVRELEVARLIAEGLANKQIAARLGLSFYTARNHVERVLGKLGAANRAHVVAMLGGAAA